MPVGQFYAISADMQRPYYVCGGLQDNGSWCGPSATRSSNGILNSDRLFRSTDRGKTWTASMASKHDGAASFSNIVTIGESPVVPGVLRVGTNDGNLQVSRDGGVSWKNVAANVPGAHPKRSSRASSRHTSRPVRPASASTGIAPTIRRPTSSRRPISARRSSTT